MQSRSKLDPARQDSGNTVLPDNADCNYPDHPVAGNLSILKAGLTIDPCLMAGTVEI